jgi:predicted dehydrogenase/threonine dehydrogenase-like Zn-dependent dehydrogenase
VKQVLLLRGGAQTREVPPPSCAPGEVLVRNAFSVISSGTERSSGEQARISPVGRAISRPDLVREVARKAAQDGIKDTWESVQRRLAEPRGVGYSSAGRVVEVGAAVTGLEPGQLVACAGAGHANHAELVAVPRNLCARVPSGVELETAALTTIAAVALHGIRLADVRVGDRTAVIGCGLIGQITCRLLRAAGSEVFALDIDKTRVDAADADHAIVIGPKSAAQVIAAAAGIGVDHVLVTAASSSSDPLILATEIARDRAEVVVVGDVPIEVPRAALFSKELSLRISRSYGPGRYDSDYERHGVDYPVGYVRWTQQRNMECILDLQARGRLTLADLIDDIVDVDQAPEAYVRLSGPPAERPRGAIAISYPDDVGDLAVSRQSEGAGAATHKHRVVGGPRIGLVGPGGFASSVIVPALTAAGAELALVGGGSGPSAAAARDFGFARVADSPEAVIADPDIDAVVICTRHATHADLAARALEAGKHVFCEKPLALSLEELETVVGAARSAPGILAVGFNRRFAPLALRLREYLAAGGAPVTITYRVSAGAMPASHWVHDLEQGGGRILGEVCHFIDTVSFLADAPVIEVHASGVSLETRPAQAQDTVAVTLRHENGSLGTIVYVPHSAAGVGKERIEAFGLAGIGVLDDYRVLDLHTSKTNRVKGHQQKGHREEIAAFVDGVRSGRAPVALSEVVNVSVATLAVVDSIRTGAPVHVGAERISE